MKKRDKIIYWISTLWLALGMVSTGIVQIIKMEEEVDQITKLGYPVYFLTILVFGNSWEWWQCLFPGFL